MPLTPRDTGTGHRTERPATSVVPRWLKVGYLLFLLTLLPVSIYQYGPLNLLWFSNVALVAGLVAVWLEHARIASMITLAVLLPEIGWTLGFLSGIARNGDPWLGITAYMFDPSIPLAVRALSIYHVILPCLLLWLIQKLGYAADALRLWLPVGWALLLASWLTTTAERNVNWAYGPFGDDVGLGWRAGWLLVLGFGATAVWWVTHLALRAIVPPVRDTDRS